MGLRVRVYAFCSCLRRSGFTAMHSNGNLLSWLDHSYTSCNSGHHIISLCPYVFCLFVCMSVSVWTVVALMRPFVSDGNEDKWIAVQSTHCLLHQNQHQPLSAEARLDVIRESLTTRCRDQREIINQRRNRN